MKQIEDNFSKCSMWTHGVLNISLKILEELSDRDNIEDEEKIEPDYYIDRPVIIWTKYTLKIKNGVIRATQVGLGSVRHICQPPK